MRTKIRLTRALVSWQLGAIGLMALAVQELGVLSLHGSCAAQHRKEEG